MWLDSKAVNCPQKWGNFKVSFLGKLTRAHGGCYGKMPSRGE